MKNYTSYKIQNLSLDYKTEKSKLPILSGFSFNFEAGKLYVIMGSNGCGKSTLVKILAGYITDFTGKIEYIQHDRMNLQRIEYLPQDYRQALFPWKKVISNICPWEHHNISIISSLFQKLISSLNLKHIANRYPYELSGGQQQILLLTRCLLSSANIILLDEPFSALDVVRRTTMANLLREEWNNKEKIVICVLHEPDEAAMLADKIIILQGPPLSIVQCIDRDNSCCNPTDNFRKRILEVIHSLSQGE